MSPPHEPDVTQLPLDPAKLARLTHSLLTGSVIPKLERLNDDHERTRDAVLVIGGFVGEPETETRASSGLHAVLDRISSHLDRLDRRVERTEEKADETGRNMAPLTRAAAASLVDDVEARKSWRAVSTRVAVMLAGGLIGVATTLLLQHCGG